jgi:glycosyltransferase involved in cell wall biosynthesis
LASDFDVVLFGLNYRGPVLDGPFRVLPNSLIGDPYGRDQLPSLLENLQPDVILVHHDPPMYSVHHETLVAYRRTHPHARAVVYCPIEWSSMWIDIARSMADADSVVLYNEAGRATFERAFGEGDRPPLSVIGHGVAETFRPLEELDRDASLRSARSAVLEDRPELLDAFIVLNANRNAPRKRIDISLRAFAEFCPGRDDAHLYLHMGMEDVGCDILTLASELGIRDRLLTSTIAPEHPRVDDGRLNEIYNACDVGLNTSTGEGWGLVAFEHGATGAAQIMPNHPSCAELWHDSATLIDANAEGEVAPAAVATAIEMLYSDRSLLARLGTAAQTLATAPRFSWDHVAAQWSELLREVSARRSRHA